MLKVEALWCGCAGKKCEDAAFAAAGDEGHSKSSTIRSSSSMSSGWESLSDDLSSMTDPRLFRLTTLELRARDTSERSQLKLEEGVRQVGVLTGWTQELWPAGTV